MLPHNSSDTLLKIYLTLGQYPILSSRVRLRMLGELIERGAVDPQTFEGEVSQMAYTSQRLEGLKDTGEESDEIWAQRVSSVRSQLIDLKYSQYFTFDDFEVLLSELLCERGVETEALRLSMNPELSPLEMVFEQARMIENLSREDREKYNARLHESKVVIIRNLISDQLRYINIAKEWFTISDLDNIRRNKIGTGRIGGKAAGMLLAVRILKTMADEDLRISLHYPESHYIGSNEMYNFMALNNLVHWNDQKYKTEEEMRAEYPAIVRDFEAGQFQPNILEKLQNLLKLVGNQPLIVRSSSLLEDNFGMSFAGKYESHFLPNQDTVANNLAALTKAVQRIYASTLNPTALLYRRHRGLLDYDERMAILIQSVVGKPYGRYYLPHAAGVAFSRNPYRWAPQIRSEDGVLRMVWGMGTRAVDRVGNDYPRLIALSHPMLRPNNEAKSIRRYSQQYVDLIDLEENSFKTLPIYDVLSSQYPPLRYLAQIDEDGYFVSMRSSVIEGDSRRLVLTFDDLLRRTPFARYMRSVLQILQEHYHSPVDMEFALELEENNYGAPRLGITILQCRPQSHLAAAENIDIPSHISEDMTIFSTHYVVPRGLVERVDYVLFVSPQGYFSLPDLNSRQELARTIGKLNTALAQEGFICVGPGRWGSSNSDLGVPIDYGDIYNTLSLVELAGEGCGPEPEPSLGTHFFQDLMESQIYPLAIMMDEPDSYFNHEFFYNTPNRLEEWLTVDEKIKNCLRLIRVIDYRPNHFIQIIMNDEKSSAMAFLHSEY